MSSEQTDSTKSTRLFAESENEDLERDRETEEWIESAISKNSGYKAYILKCLYKLQIPGRESHVHGVLEPLSRSFRATFTE